MKLNPLFRHKHTAMNFAIEFSISWLIFFFLAYAIHEYSHLLMLQLLGGSGSIASWNLTVAHFMPDLANVNPLVGLAGGWGVMFVYSMLILLIDDIQERAALFIIAIAEGTYGIGEMLFHMGIEVNLVAVGFFGYLIGTLPIIVLLYKKFGHRKRWVRKVEYIYE